MIKPIAKRPGFRCRLAFLPLVAAGLLAAPLFSSGGTITEPATVFYGRIFDVSTGHPYPLLEGDLTWVIRRADGVNQVLRARLQPLDQGRYSYRLSVPHSALAMGLSSSTGSVPLRNVDDAHSHSLIAVNGQRAAILGPTGSDFDAAQALRTATHRLDLAVNLQGVDSDGNGLPDWWETQYGLNLANSDSDGDGLNNLAEFRNGSNPLLDNRIPSLETREIRAYADGTTVARLRALDTDSAPSNLVYTVLAAPEVGSLLLRNAAVDSNSVDLVLANGTSFNQADVAAGRLVYSHPVGADSEGASFTVTLHDENPAHPSSTNQVSVLLYRPLKEVSDSAVQPASGGLPSLLPTPAGFPAEELAYVGSYLLSRELNYIVSDATAEARPLLLSVPSSGISAAEYTTTYLPRFGPDRHHVLLGGQAADTLAGGKENDILIGGPGDDILRGSDGADVFMLASPADGNDTIEDFNAGQKDVIDISRLLSGTSPWLTDYLQVTSSPTNTVLRINPKGAGTNFQELRLTLAGVTLQSGDLYTLADAGQLVTGDKALPALVNIAASSPNASENGPQAGLFTVTRSGSTASPLTVGLQITGSAANGVDYHFLPSQVTLAAGQRSATISVVPFVDAITELSEVVEISLQGGPGYAIGASPGAQIAIADLLPQVAIQALEPRAIKAGQSPGVLLISRSGATDRSVLVRLQIAGTAINGTDYTRIPSFISLQANQTIGLIDIVPALSANLIGGKSVDVGLKSDATYLLDDPAAARVMLIEELTSFAQWRARYFPQSSGSIAVFAAEDPGGLGIPNLQRYAYGLDALAPDRNRLPRPLLRDGFLTVDLWQRPDATDVAYGLSLSSNLFQWDASPTAWQPLLPSPVPDPNVLTFRASQPVTNTPQLFFKVKVDYIP